MLYEEDTSGELYTRLNERRGGRGSNGGRLETKNWMAAR